MQIGRALTFALAAAVSFPGCAPVDEPWREAADKPGDHPKLGPRPQVTKAPDNLKQRIEAALENVKKRDLLTTHAFWTIFHGILGSGFETTVFHVETRERIRAIDYICKGGPVRGLSFIPTAHGLDVYTARDFVGQGHQDQFVAEMAQWGMRQDHRFLVDGKQYTFEDFVRHAQMRASPNAGQELSWAIIVIGQYRGTDVSWTNERGEKLHFEDLVRYELHQSIDEAACGGTHRLFGLTWVYHLHLKKGGQTTGVWNEVAAKIVEHKERAKMYRNPDGSFSTRYLAGPGDVPDAQLRIGTTGHVLEWLALALPDSELREGWVQEAANRLSMMILDNAASPVESGALYHAAHGLHIYHARVFGGSSGKAEELPVPPTRSEAPEAIGSFPAAWPPR